MLLEVILKKLSLNGLEPVGCSGAEEAPEYLKGKEDLSNVIWLDYPLGGMDGMTFLREIKANNRWSQIPVVVVSNSASSDEAKGMLALGVDKYFLKAEYRLDQIVETIKGFIPDKKE